MMHILPIKAFNDNYIWCLHNQQQCAIVDPGDAAPVKAFIQQQQLQLTDILITHHHWDHTDGIDELQQSWPQVQISGLESDRVKQINHHVKAGDKLQLSGIDVEFEVMLLPGHTRDHIAFYHPKALFCGDTLFSAGCGRLFEGSPGQMFHSLNQLAALPGDTPVYCTHEYTQSNVDFARAVDPDNQDLQEYAQWVSQQRAQNQPTLPSSIAREKCINPFLRSHTQSVRQSVATRFNKHFDNDVDVFAALRQWKDKF